MNLVWAEQARLDLRQIYSRIAADDPRAAERLRDRIEDCTSKLQRVSGMGRPGRWKETRELIVSGTPYIVPYMIKGSQIHILRVYHAARLWPGHFET